MEAFFDIFVISAHLKIKLSGIHFKLRFFSEIPNEEWASNSAKLAIRTLFDAEIAETKSKYTPTVDCCIICTEDIHEGTQEGTDGSEVNEENVLCTGESRARVRVEESTRLKTQTMIIQRLQNPVTGAIDFCHDDEGSSSLTIFNSFTEDEQAVAGSVTFSEGLSGTNSIDKLEMDDFLEEESGSHSDLDTTAALRENFKLTGIGKLESNKVEIQLLNVLENLELNGNVKHQDGSANVSISAVSDAENSAHVNGFPSDALAGEAMRLVQTKVVICTEVAEACHLVATEDSFEHGSCNGEDEMPRSEVQHSKESFSAKESDQDDRSQVVEHEMNTCEMQHFEEISIDECNGANPVTVTTTNRCDILETKGGQEIAKNAKAADRFKHSKATVRLKHNYQTTDGIGKNKKERAARPQWQ